jgi:hypothetical protein
LNSPICIKEIGFKIKSPQIEIPHPDGFTREF